MARSVSGARMEDLVEADLVFFVNGSEVKTGFPSCSHMNDVQYSCQPSRDALDSPGI